MEEKQLALQAIIPVVLMFLRHLEAQNLDAAAGNDRLCAKVPLNDDINLFQPHNYTTSN